jgi:hypothetical protein
MEVREVNGQSAHETEVRDANACMAIGVVVAVVGAAAATMAKAVCPLCVLVAPALVGIGALKRYAITVKEADVGKVTVLNGDNEIV